MRMYVHEHSHAIDAYTIQLQGCTWYCISIVPKAKAIVHSVITMEDILSSFSNFKADLMKEMGEKNRIMKEEILDKDAVFQKFMQQFENIQATQKDEVLKMSKEIDGLRLEFGEFQNFVGFLQKQMETVINENVQLRRELSKCNEVIHSWIDSQFQTVQQGTELIQ